MNTYTAPQAKALAYAFEKSGALYAPGPRMGGAFRRCCQRLVDEGLLSDHPPFPITLRGLHALREIRSKKYADSGCMAYLDDLKRVEAALAEFPHMAATAAS